MTTGMGAAVADGATITPANPSAATRVAGSTGKSPAAGNDPRLQKWTDG